MKKDERCFYKDIEIRFYDCDRNKRARIETIMRYMSDIGGIYCASKGYTHDWLWEHEFVFLLSRASIHINRIPKSEEKLTIETWEREVKGVLFYRDVIFHDESGEPIVECSTAWVGANPNTRSILKPSQYQGEIHPYEEKKADCLPPQRLKPQGEFEELGSRKIVYSDIDGNNHVYNAIYAAIACDFLPNCCMERELADFRINFKQEAVLGDTLLIKAAISENSATVIGELGGIVSFECELKFK